MELQTKDIVKKVKQIEIRTRRRTEASLMGQYQSAFKGQGMTFSEVRPYQFGDEIRRIDWNKTARFREPYVKMMEEERELTVLLVVDISSSMNYGSQHSLKKEYVAEICASIGFSAVDNNDKVGLILYADKVYKVIPPQKGRKHILTMISLLLSSEYIASESNPAVALHYMMNVFKKKSFVFLVSDFNDSIETKTLRVAGKKHAMVGIRVADDKDIQIPDVGYTLFTDSETGKQVWVDTSSARFRYTFAEEQKQKQKRVREEFEAASSGFISLKTGEDYAKPLVQYFQSR